MITDLFELPSEKRSWSKFTFLYSIRYLWWSVVITAPSLDHVKLTAGAADTLQINLAVSPLLLAALLSAGDWSIIGLSVKYKFYFFNKK